MPASRQCVGTIVSSDGPELFTAQVWATPDGVELDVKGSGQSPLCSAAEARELSAFLLSAATTVETIAKVRP